MGSIGFVVTGFLSMVCVAFLAAAMADGSSVVTQKTRRYGVGVFQDSTRYEWREDEHILNALGCDDHLKLGKTVKACSIIAIVLSAFAVLTSLLGASTGKGIFGLATAGLSAVMFLMFLVAMSCGWAIYGKEYTCDNNFDLKVSDLFDLNYGLFFLLTGTVASLINIGALVATGALSDETTAGSTEPVEVMPPPKEDA